MTVEILNERFQGVFVKYHDKKAITFFRNGNAETDVTYGELDRDACRMARSFIDLGVKKGDRVILYFEKSLLFVVAHLALLIKGNVGSKTTYDNKA